MTKLKFGIASAIAIASVATPLVIQHHAVVQLRQDNQDLRQQLAQLASVAQEKAQLSNVLANAMAQSRNPGEPNELLRLRGEVARLRNVERELTRIRQDKSGPKALEVNTSSIVEQPEQPRFIFVAGEVSTPGRFIWTNGMTLATLIELAHGYTDTANRSRAEIMDTNGLSITVNYPESSPPTASKDEIHPGVRVFIPRSDAGDGVSQ